MNCGVLGQQQQQTRAMYPLTLACIFGTCLFLSLQNVLKISPDIYRCSLCFAPGYDQVVWRDTQQHFSHTLPVVQHPSLGDSAYGGKIECPTFQGRCP